MIHPGLAQRMSAGTGILHSERNDSWRLTGEPAHRDAVHFVQMWVVPDEAGIEPGYEQRDISAELATGALVPVASGMAAHRTSAAIRIRNGTPRCTPPGCGRREVPLPEAPYVHVFVARGAVDLEGAGRLAEGDAARVTAAEGQRVAAVAGPAEVLVWEMHA